MLVVELQEFGFHLAERRRRELDVLNLAHGDEQAQDSGQGLFVLPVLVACARSIDPICGIGHVKSLLQTARRGRIVREVFEPQQDEEDQHEGVGEQQERAERHRIRAVVLVEDPAIQQQRTKIGERDLVVRGHGEHVRRWVLIRAELTVDHDTHEAQRRADERAAARAVEERRDADEGDAAVGLHQLKVPKVGPIAAVQEAERHEREVGLGRQHAGVFAWRVPDPVLDLPQQRKVHDRDQLVDDDQRNDQVTELLVLGRVTIDR
mmetsp:Transcript_40203/g.107748  ORF Transcript_40203/g.107748 Transcript_40203/m.107748 type:complete len:264 (-) Transcript_40203:1932-2723(-)